MSIEQEITIPFIEGDGIGPEVTKATQLIVNAALEKIYHGKKKIVWKEIFAGGKSFEQSRQWLPEETLEEIRKHKIAIKGPLTTPVGGGIRSINVSLRQTLDLYACIRPVRYFEGVPSPVKYPQRLNVVIFRENTEDVYAGIEWEAKSPEAEKLTSFLKTQLGSSIREGSGIGIKPMSQFGTERLVRMAIEYAKNQNRKKVTLVHKGNIMKFTEGAFCKWGYDLAVGEFKNDVVIQKDLDKLGEQGAANKIVVSDCIADAMFQMLLLSPEDYSVIVAPNLNGDYLSDACAAQVGGLGMAPGANIGDSVALFEATHGTAPTIAGKDIANPGSLLLSAVMMLQHLGWNEAAEKIRIALEKTIIDKTVTADLAAQMPGAKQVGCSEFTELIIKHL